MANAPKNPEKMNTTTSSLSSYSSSASASDLLYNLLHALPHRALVVDAALLALAERRAAVGVGEDGGVHGTVPGLTRG